MPRRHSYGLPFSGARHAALISLFLAAATGCAGGGQAGGAQSPEAAAPSSEAQAPGATETTQKDKGPAADVLYKAHQAVPPVADSCTAGTPHPAQSECPEALPDLAVALSLSDEPRDTALAKLEECDNFPVGLVRALRAELGPAECADALVAPLVGDGVDSTQIPGDIRESLVALGLGAQLRRLAVGPPDAPQSRKKADLEQYFAEELFPWIGAQAQAIFVIASQGTALSGYARGIVAVEAGNADMRFVEIARDAPIADEFSSHQEARDVYYATLDEQLDPRKTRGRNAALVGLREMARIGVRESERVASARALLSRAYGGRRVNALDTLFLPAVPPQKANTDAAGVVSRVPTPYSTILTGKAKVTAHLVRAQLQMGMTLAMRRHVETSGDTESRLLLARALFESGRTYFRAEDFQACHALLSALLDSKESLADLDESQRDEAILLRALSVALLAGPKDAAEMIAKGPRFAEQLGNLVLLDGLAEKDSELGGRAAFNAAYLRELVAPVSAPDYWNDLASRYRAAADRLKGDEKRISSDRSRACSEIERTLRKEAAARKAQSN